jgi:transposase, IS5 family
MRNAIDLQMKFGETAIKDIKFDLKSRDEIPKLLMGLQFIYTDPIVRKEVFDILTGIIPQGTNIRNGRPGMELWKILVLGVLRLNCNWDYDKVKEIADNHKKVREMLGHSEFEGTVTYPLQTIRDNISLFTPEILDKINQIVVKAGHNLVKKKEEPLKGKCDSFVVETDVHYPTDINLLFDAVRKMIRLIGILCSIAGSSEWRQNHSNILKIKKLFNYIRKLRHSTSKDEKKKAEQEELIVKVNQEYIDLAREYVEKAKQTITRLCKIKDVQQEKIGEIEEYIRHAERQIDQIRRRVICEETIPHNEKEFSIFEEHTEWISKGKAGVLQELGVKVCIIEDQFRFILHHRVMENETDSKVAILMAQEAKNRFEDLAICSFDKGFYSGFNMQELGKVLDAVILPKKGRLTAEDKERENSEEFVRLRKEHSAIESAINAVENHGLDRCPDHGITGFKRYVALSVLARNLQVLGNIIQQKELRRQERIQKYKRTWNDNREPEQLRA